MRTITALCKYWPSEKNVILLAVQIYSFQLEITARITHNELHNEALF